MKSILKKVAGLALAAMALAAFGCKSEIEYVYKTYCSAVTFTSEATADGVKVTMATTTEGAVIYYTTDGTLPTEKSTKYSETVEFTKDATVKAIFKVSPASIATGVPFTVTPSLLFPLVSTVFTIKVYSVPFVRPFM